MVKTKISDVDAIDHNGSPSSLNDAKQGKSHGGFTSTSPASNANLHQMKVTMTDTSLVLRPCTLCKEKGLVTVERILGSCKLSILVFAKANQIAALRFSCDIASCCEATLYKVSCLDFALTNQNVALRFGILLRSNVLYTAVKSRARTTKKPFQCHQTLPCAGIGGWERDCHTSGHFDLWIFIS